MDYIIVASENVNAFLAGNTVLAIKQFATYDDAEKFAEEIADTYFYGVEILPKEVD